MTYSIIAYDEESQRLGVALQSYYYGCGPRTISAVPGAGIVVMQMVPEKLYGDTGIAGMRESIEPESILERVTAADPGRDLRQVAMIDVLGRISAVTGAGCIPASGHALRNKCCVQGAMVESAEVWESIADAFETSEGPLEERMIGALRAGEAAGGDIRGRRAGALIVVACHESASWPESRPVNIRIDESEDPVSEMERQLRMQRHITAIELAFERAFNGDVSGAIRDYAQLASVAPNDPDVTMRYGMVLAMAGELNLAREQLERMASVHAGWARVPARLMQANLLPRVEELRSLIS